jgi:hypothetical protein
LDYENISLLIVDEVSTIDSRIIAMLDLRLRQIYNNTFDFGGLPVIFAGDFNQLGPVKKVFLPKDMMTFAMRLKKSGKLHSPPAPTFTDSQGKDTDSPPQASLTCIQENLNQTLTNCRTTKQIKSVVQQIKQDIARFKSSTLAYRGAYLMSHFVRQHLQEQMRATGDTHHTALVKKLACGRSIEIADILQYKHLSADDLRNNPQEWKYAPILVSTNKERVNLARIKAREWARDHNTHVYRWRTSYRLHLNRPPNNRMEDIIENNAFFWQFFVPGAPCHLLHNINPDLALVNGSPATLHSLSYDPLSHEPARIYNLTHGHDAKPYGEEIEVETPLSVNVQMEQALDGRPISTKRRLQLKQLAKMSVVHGSIVIPLTKGLASRSNLDYNKFSYRTGVEVSPYATIETKLTFPYDLAFAMTVHKAQGRTIPRVVIDLTNRRSQYSQMEFAAVFVALSRVRSADHIRLLVHNTFTATQNHLYLTDLKPDYHVKAFYNGFRGSRKWSPQLALN